LLKEPAGNPKFSPSISINNLFGIFIEDLAIERATLEISIPIIIPELPR
jgi:hypothetical protein